MSERGSFVTEYMYCDKCLEKMKRVLIQSDRYLYGRQIEDAPIIAGRLGSLGPGADIVMFKFQLFNRENAPCHPVKVALIPDCAEPRIMTVFPNGDVDKYDSNKYEEGHRICEFLAECYGTKEQNK